MEGKWENTGLSVLIEFVISSKWERSLFWRVAFMHQRQAPTLGLPCQAVNWELAMALVSGYQSRPPAGVAAEGLCLESCETRDLQLSSEVWSPLYCGRSFVWFILLSQHRNVHIYFFQPGTILIFKSYGTNEILFTSSESCLLVKKKKISFLPCSKES